MGGGITQRIMPGGHGSILDEPYVQKVARAFDRSLVAVERKEAAK